MDLYSSFAKGGGVRSWIIFIPPAAAAASRSVLESEPRSEEEDESDSASAEPNFNHGKESVMCLESRRSGTGRKLSQT